MFDDWYEHPSVQMNSSSPCLIKFNLVSFLKSNLIFFAIDVICIGMSKRRTEREIFKRDCVKLRVISAYIFELRGVFPKSLYIGPEVSYFY